MRRVFPFFLEDAQFPSAQFRVLEKMIRLRFSKELARVFPADPSLLPPHHFPPTSSLLSIFREFPRAFSPPLFLFSLTIPVKWRFRPRQQAFNFFFSPVGPMILPWSSNVSLLSKPRHPTPSPFLFFAPPFARWYLLRVPTSSGSWVSPPGHLFPDGASVHITVRRVRFPPALF